MHWICTPYSAYYEDEESQGIDGAPCIHEAVATGFIVVDVTD